MNAALRLLKKHSVLNYTNIGYKFPVIQCLFGNSMHHRAQWLLKHLELLPHPEGGYYRETFRSSLMVFSPRAKANRNAMTHIYYLLAGGQISRFHRVAHDECWMYQEGADLLLHTIDQDINIYRSSRIGSVPESLSNPPSQRETITPPAKPAALIPADTWQAAESTGAYTLVSCIVAPGFEFNDFTVLQQCREEKENVLKFWPELVRFI
jgi:predicted cupin superfamily sugar epimerase